MSFPGRRGVRMLWGKPSTTCTGQYTARRRNHRR